MFNIKFNLQNNRDLYRFTSHNLYVALSLHSKIFVIITSNFLYISRYIYT